MSHAETRSGAVLRCLVLDIGKFGEQTETWIRDDGGYSGLQWDAFGTRYVVRRD